MSDFFLPSVLIFGRSAIGKTLSVVKALGPHAYWICAERNALAPANDPELNPHGTVPEFHHCLSQERPCDEVRAVIQTIAPRLIKREFRAVVVDTLSTLADREMQVIHAKGIKDDYGRASNVLRERIMGIVHTLLALNVVVICLCHDRDPTFIEGRLTPGGPGLPGKSAISLPQQFDLVLHAKIDMTTGGKRRVFHVDHLDNLWLTKDRYNVLPFVDRSNGDERAADMNDLLSLIQKAAKKVETMRQIDATSRALARAG